MGDSFVCTFRLGERNFIHQQPKVNEFKRLNAAAAAKVRDGDHI
jgi:hypothetical protein